MTRNHTVFPDTFPASWASGWGDDEYGLWMSFNYKGVSHLFRWCEPGTFLMGSPANEPERYDNETQHPVTLSRGFWIAETPVTQALWEVFMGDNPSRFKGAELPVENVSWDDAQRFISKLNGSPFPVVKVLVVSCRDLINANPRHIWCGAGCFRVDVIPAVRGAEIKLQVLDAASTWGQVVLV